MEYILYCVCMCAFVISSSSLDLTDILLWPAVPVQVRVPALGEPRETAPEATGQERYQWREGRRAAVQSAVLCDERDATGLRDHQILVLPAAQAPHIEWGVTLFQ